MQDLDKTLYAFLAIPRSKLFGRRRRSASQSAGLLRVPPGDKTPEVPSPVSLEVELQPEARGESQTSGDTEAGGESLASVDDTARERSCPVQTATSKKLAISASCSSHGEPSGDSTASPPDAGFGVPSGAAGKGIRLIGLCVSHLNRKDKYRQLRAHEKEEIHAKKRRKSKRMAEKRAEESRVSREGVTYASGGF